MQDLITLIKSFIPTYADRIEHLLLNPTSNTPINIDETGTYGHTALHLAVYKGNINAVKILLDHGANINVFDHLGLTPIVFAPCDIKLTNFLIKHGANVHLCDQHNSTQLMQALRWAKPEAVKTLIEYCVDVYRVNNAGFSALTTPIYDKELYKLMTSYRAYIQLLYFTMVFPDLPTYIILWIVDWLDLREMTEYRKVAYIEGFKRSIKKIEQKN